jgi:hypothetical protein
MMPQRSLARFDQQLAEEPCQRRLARRAEVPSIDTVAERSIGSGMISTSAVAAICRLR